MRDIIGDIKSTRVVVARKINSAMMQLYRNIGKRLSMDVAEKGYGSSVVKWLSADLIIDSALEFGWTHDILLLLVMNNAG
ncbi:MAG: DUF1016 N-terminal domain-containing protein [Bacteroidales bacterium]|nr:DUF1016 N-terminal domain-containing protein [Bacteroidales bacterium]